MSVPREPVSEALQLVLERSRSLGLIGTGPIDDHIAHAQSFVDSLGSVTSVLDLGSGGGLPGLVIAAARPDLELVLLDAQERRCAFLRWAVARLDVTRCQVVQGRAEVVGRGVLRAKFDAVVARSFGRPAMTAECGGAFLRAGGQLIVSEPPGPTQISRWPKEGLAILGQKPGHRLEGEGSRLQFIRQATEFSVEFPRSANLMRTAPVFN